MSDTTIAGWSILETVLRPSLSAATAMNVRDALIETPSGSFVIRDSGGAGRGLLLVHGTGHNLEVWEPLVQRLRGDFRVVTFDLRGHGQTPLDSANAEEHWHDLAGIIDTLGLQKPILVGHSSGGYAVTAHAAAAGACAGLVVIDGFVPDTRETALRATGVVSRKQLGTMFRYGWVATDEQKEAWVRQVRADAPGDWLNSGIDPDLVEAFTRRSFMRHADGWLRRPTFEEIDHLSQLDERRPILPALDVYERVHVPADFVFARHGLYRERRAEVERLARKMGARFIEFDAGHNVHMQQPAALHAVVRDLAARV